MPVPSARLLHIAWSFLYLGLTTWGGMWGAASRIEDELIKRRRWLPEGQMPTFMLAATLVPAPSYLGLAALTGHRLRGWAGGAVAVVCLAAPAFALTMLTIVLISPDLLRGPLAPLARVVAVAVVGILLGSARQQIASSRLAGWPRTLGLILGLAVTVAIVTGLPILLVVLAGMVLGALVIRGGVEQR